MPPAAKPTAPRDFRREVRIFWFAVLSVPSLILLGLLLAWVGAFGTLPSTEEIANPKSFLATQLVDANGEQLGTFFEENRVHTEYDQLPLHLVQALVATEDERFYEHAGIDFRSLGRALASFGTQGGGSTLTQQLAKQMFHEPASSKAGRVLQKFKEWIIALQLESRYTKDEIIALYFNQFDFLYQAVGVHSASRIYFGKNPQQLTVPEAAVLVGMVKNPSIYNPVRRFEETTARRNTVLRQMERNGYLTEEEYTAFAATPLEVRFNPQTHDRGLAPYLREYIRGQLKEWVKDHPKPDGSLYNLYTDGLKIYTTVDIRMQRYAEEAVAEHLSNLQRVFFKQIKGRKYGPFYFQGNAEDQYQTIMNRGMKQTPRYRNLVESGAGDTEIQRIFRTKIPMKVFSWKGPVDTVLSPLDSIRYMKSFYQCGLLSVEPQTGFVKAWVGGIDYAHFQYDHVAQGQRQVGSTFKPFVYAAAMEQKKFSPCMEVPNQKVCIQAGEFGLTEDWCPSNSDNEYGGLLTLKQALAKSVNTITTYLMKQIGPQAVVQLARALGMTSDLPEVPSIALGTVDLTVEEMVGAYTAFGNGGVYTKPIVITRIEDKNGVLLDEFVPESREALSPEVAFAVTSLLSGVTEYGTGARLRSSGGGYPDNVVTGFPYAFTNPIAGKTGTTQNNSDGWFMGMVPNLVTGVWAGCDDRAAHFGSTVFGQGATTALPVWALYMRKCYADPALGVRSNAFDLPSTPMTIRTDCKAAAAEAATDEWSEYD